MNVGCTVSRTIRSSSFQTAQASNRMHIPHMHRADSPSAKHSHLHVLWEWRLNGVLGDEMLVGHLHGHGGSLRGFGR